MVLYLVGLGLGDESDVTARGAAAIRASDRVFLEAYTSLLPGVSPARLEAAFGKRIELAHRETVESEADEAILAPARAGSVAFLVVGDPFGATTHTDLFLRAARAGVETVVVHNASIMTAVGACGLQLSSFGQTVSVPFFRPDWRPDSWYDKLAHNASGGLHSLVLLDIKMREPDFALLVRTGRTAHLPPRFMTVNEAVAQMLEVEARRGLGVCGPEARAVGMARVGQCGAGPGAPRGERQLIVSGTLAQLAKIDFGPPLHSIALVGSGAHELELEMLEHWKVRGDEPAYAPPREDGGDSDSEGDAAPR
jgi:diphthine synthase